MPNNEIKTESLVYTDNNYTDNNRIAANVMSGFWIKCHFVYLTIREGLVVGISVGLASWACILLLMMILVFPIYFAGALVAGGLSYVAIKAGSYLLEGAKQPPQLL